MSPYLRSIVVAAALCGAATTASAQMSYEIAQSPEQNNYLSQRYDYLLETNFAFRQYRMRKECSPIDDAALNSDCIGSFDTFEPWRGQ